MLDENLIHDCLQIGLNENLSPEEMKNRIFKRIIQQLNQWTIQKRFYVKKASSITMNKILPLTQQIATQIDTDGNDSQQVKQLQEQINKLRQEIQDLKSERERERE